MTHPVPAQAVPQLANTLFIPIVLFGASIGGLLSGTPLGFIGIALLGIAWRVLFEYDAPPALRLAFIYQWVQVTIGLFYFGATGRFSQTISYSNYRLMVAIGLGSITALFGGIALAKYIATVINPAQRHDTVSRLTNRDLALLYLGSLIISGALQQTGRFFPGMYQAATVFAYLRYAFLYIAFRRMSSPTFQARLFVPLLAFEVLLGFTGFFAEFREPVIFALLGLVQIYDMRKVRHTVVLGLTSFAVVIMVVTWTAIKPEYRSAFEDVGGTRAQRISLVRELSGRFAADATVRLAETIDLSVDRLWAVYYPALAVDRVPALIPHTNGDLMWSGIRHILMPRLFFPDKPGLISDSEKVREYSGVHVAGAEEGTSIAFGYATELYIDFGVPNMFFPLFMIGMLLFWCVRRVDRMIRDPDIAAACTACITWFAIFQFEQSWSRMLGVTLTLLIVIGISGVAIDRYLWNRARGLRGRAAYIP